MYLRWGGIGAVLCGVASCSAGCYLPMWMTPASNQGPLLALYTLPLGVLGGALLGVRCAPWLEKHLGPPRDDARG
ncbi:MAG: hypothetical protein IPN34_26015 [Planctomycetes bacterium]|nr:hypothetical protein [Planctomycetota bacterium]